MSLYLAHTISFLSAWLVSQEATTSSTPVKQDNVSHSLDLLFSPIDNNVTPRSPQNHSESSDSDQEVEEESTEDSEGSDEDDSVIVPDTLLLGAHEQTLDESECEDSASNNPIESKSQIFQNVKIHSLSHLSVNEGIQHIMNLYLQNKLSKAGLGRALKTICALMPEDHNLPQTSFEVLNYIESLAPPVSASRHYYCRECLYYHGSEIVGNCEICRVETEFDFFFNFDIAELIQFFFESRNLASIMDGADVRGDNLFEYRTLRDGSVFKSLNRNRNKYDVHVVANSDGVRIRKGAYELWLAMFTIVEVPIHMQKSFLTVLGVWYAEKKPSMLTFLKPFAEKMETLDGDGCGVKWTHPETKEQHISCVRLLVTVLDAPARGMVQNSMLFNSVYGCNLCEIKAKLTAPVPGKRRVRRYFYEANLQLRTKERMLRQAELIGDRKHVKGVKGPSVLCGIPSVDISKCIVPEYLHSCLLGVCKQVLNIWTKKDGPWCVKDRISEIDNILKTFKHPSFIHRNLRQLKSLKYWKASDFYYFMFFEALFCLSGFLPNVYLQHFTLFIMGLFKLIKSCVTEVEIREADIMLRLFVLDFGTLYGDRELVSNVHQLLHLAMCVRLYGPLHCFSAFIFEDLNGIIAKSTHGTKHVAQEIVNNIKICQGIHMLRTIISTQDVNNLKTTRSAGELLGKEIKITLCKAELDMLSDTNPQVFARAKLNYDVFSSELYKSLQSEDYHIMWSESNNERYGSIKYFAGTKNGNFVIIRRLPVDHTKVLFHCETLKCVEHLIPVMYSEDLVAVRINDIVDNIVKVGKIESFIYKRPNLYRYVM